MKLTQKIFPWLTLTFSDLDLIGVTMFSAAILFGLLIGLGYGLTIRQLTN